MVRTLRKDVSSFPIGFYFLKKHFLLSFGMYILSTSRKCASLWVSTAHYVAASRTAPFTSLCGGILTRNDGSSRYRSTKSTLLKDSSLVYEAILGAEPSSHSQVTHDDKAQSSESLKSIPRGYHNASVLLVGDGDLSFASALSSLKVCRRYSRQILRSVICPLLVSNATLWPSPIFVNQLRMQPCCNHMGFQGETDKKLS